MVPIGMFPVSPIIMSTNIINTHEERKEGKALKLFSVSDGQKMELPTLSMRQLQLATSDEAALFVREVLHDERTIGWPSTDDFKREGFIIQPITNRAAKVILVMNHPSALTLLALYVKTYEHIGFDLAIDANTFFRTQFVLEEDENSAKASEQEPSERNIDATQSLESFGMEVA
jgi:hypothetical protein